MPGTNIPLPTDIWAQLELSRWNSLSAEQRFSLLENLTRHFSASEYRLHDLRLEPHGPNQGQIVAIWQDSYSQLDFALILGGQFAPGYAEEQLKQYRHLHELLYPPTHDSIPLLSMDATISQTEFDEYYDPPDRVRLFASMAPCDMHHKPPVTIRPFLMATTLVPAAAPHLRSVVDLPKWQQWDELIATKNAIRLRWPMVDRVLLHYRWDLPTSAEFEWALQGGLAGLFYWGNKLPLSIFTQVAHIESPEQISESELELEISFEDLMTWEIDAQRPHQWPYYNRFGLASMLSSGTWCQPNNDPQDPFPLKLRGGAAACYPWQDCGEWKLLFSAAEWRISEATDYACWNSLRPVIRLYPAP